MHFFASAIINSMADTRKPDDPMQVSHTNESLFVLVIRAIKEVTNRGVSTTSLSLSFSIETQSFKQFKILPVKSKWILLSRSGRLTCL